MKKRYLLIFSIILVVLSISCVSAFFDTIECEDFSMEIPEGLERPKGGYQADPEHSVSLWSGLVKDGELFRRFEISTLPFEDLTDKMDVVDEYTEGDLKVMKGEVFDGIEHGGNCTYAEFDKDGKHFYLVVDYDCDLDEIDLTKDVKMVKDLKVSVQVKK